MFNYIDWVNWRKCYHEARKVYHEGMVDYYKGQTDTYEKWGKTFVDFWSNVISMSLMKYTLPPIDMNMFGMWKK